MLRPLAGALLALVLLGMPALVLSSHAATTGFLEICKAADGPGVTGTFVFTVAGQSVEVPAGACSAAIQLPPGTVTVTEMARPGTVVTGIQASPSGRLVSADPASRSAQVTIVAGDVSTQTIVTFANRAETGQLKVCKVAGPGVAAGTIFAFHAAGQTLTVPAGPGPGGFCSVAGTFAVGTLVTVSEAVPGGMEVSAVEVAPPERAAGPAALSAATQAVTIGSGVTEVTFTNRQTPSVVAVPQGFLRICKRAEGPGVSGTFSFTVAGQAVDVAVNGCSPALQLPAGTVTVTETARPGTLLTAVEAQPSARLVSRDLAARSARVSVVAGDMGAQTVATFVNRAETGQLKVCKVAGAGVTTGTQFAFRVAGTALSVPAGPAPGGFCVRGGEFPVGTSVTVSETIPGGMQVSAISVAPPERAGGPADLGAGSQVASIGSGVTEVTFTNRQAPSVVAVPQGFLRVCKRADGPGVAGTFGFTVGGQAVDVAVNGCSALLQVPAGIVTVTETARAGTAVSAVDVLPPDRRVGTDLASRRVQVAVAPGDAGTQVIVVFANRAELPSPTTTTAPPTTPPTTSGVSPTTITPPGTSPSTTSTTVPATTVPSTTVPSTTVPTSTTAPPTPGTSTTTSTVPSASTTTTLAGPTTTTSSPTGIATTTSVPGPTTTTIPTGGILPTTLPGPTTTVPAGVTSTSTTVPGGVTSTTTTAPNATTTTSVPPGPTPTTLAPTTPSTTTPPGAPTPTAAPAARQPGARAPAALQPRRGPLSATGNSPLLPALSAVLLVLGAILLKTSRRTVAVPRSDLGVRRPPVSRNRPVTGARSDARSASSRASRRVPSVPPESTSTGPTEAEWERVVGYARPLPRLSFP